MNATPRRFYLDHNASAPLLPEAREALLRALGAGANPSSVHREGRASRQMVEDARRAVARLAGLDAEGVTFTSGASEAAATCLSPVWLRGAEEVAVERLAVAAGDHLCIRAGGRFAPEAVTRLAVDRNGLLDLVALRDWLDAGVGRTAMLALCLANNETGVLHPLASLVEAIGGRDVILILDAVQAAGRVDLGEAAAVADALILSGHKIGAAPGVGAFVLKDASFRPLPLIAGGGQESYRRAGTEAVAAIAAFGAAARVAQERLAEGMDGLALLRDRLEERLAAAGATIVGGGAARLANTSLVAHPAMKAETAQIALDLQGFAVSSGSACSSGKVGASHVLEALAAAGAPVDPAYGAIRVSFGPETGADALEAFAQAYEGLLAAAQGLAKRMVA